MAEPEELPGPASGEAQKSMTPGGVVCPMCNGTRKVSGETQGDVKERPCPRCHGTGRQGYLTK